MKRKTWNIGEYCKGDVIETILTDTKLTVIAKDWDFKAGSTKDSDQSNAQEFERREFLLSPTSVFGTPYQEVYDYLTTLTTSYYADKIIEWAGLKIFFV